MIKIKVRKQTIPQGVQYQRQPSTGNPDMDFPSVSEVESNPSKYEVIEDYQTGAHNGRADCACRECMKKYRNTNLREDDQQNLQATKTSLRSRNILPVGNGGIWKRDGKKPVTAIIGADGSWKCCDAVGADHTTLESHLDSVHPSAGAQGSESDQSLRLRKAFEQLLPKDEAALAARGPQQNGSEIDVTNRGNSLLSRLDMDLLEPER
jgi:hypothetical protein